MSGPNFFVVGAAKSGTTAFYHELRRHPDVFLPAVKEPHVYAYLADPSVARHLFADEAAARRRYQELYREVRDEKAVGDASTTNLVVHGAAEVIESEVPAARIVAVLRHPVDQAYSHWRHFRAAGGEDIADFAEAVLRPTFGFLGVDDSRPMAPLGRFNEMPAAPPRGLRGRLRDRRRAAPPTLDPALRAELTATFHDEIDGLEELIGRDLSDWR